MLSLHKELLLHTENERGGCISLPTEIATFALVKKLDVGLPIAVDQRK